MTNQRDYLIERHLVKPMGILDVQGLCIDVGHYLASRTEQDFKDKSVQTYREAIRTCLRCEKGVDWIMDGTHRFTNDQALLIDLLEEKMVEIEETITESTTDLSEIESELNAFSDYLER